MAFVHGKKTVFKLDSSAGSIVDLSAYTNSTDFDQALEAAETTAFSKDAKTYIPGLKDATISIGGNFDPTLDSHMNGVINALAAGTLATATFNYGPAGSTSGLPLYTGECLVTDYKVSGGVGDVVTWTADIQVTDTVTRTTF